MGFFDKVGDFFEDVGGSVVGGLTGGLGGAVASGLVGELFGGDEPSPPSAGDFAGNFQQVFGGLQNQLPASQFTPRRFENIPGVSITHEPGNIPQTPILQQFEVPEISQEALSTLAEQFGRQAETGFGTEALEELTGKQFDLARERTQLGLDDAMGALDERLAARGIGRSGIAAGQTRELQERATLNISQLANQIAQRNAERRLSLQQAGLQGLGQVGEAAFRQGIQTTRQQQATGQQDFQNQLRRAQEISSLFQRNAALSQRNFENIFRARSAESEQQRAADLLNLDRVRTLFGAAQGVVNPASRAALANYQSALGQFNQGTQAISTLFPDPALQNQRGLQNELLQQQINRLSDLNTGGAEDDDFTSQFGDFDFSLSSGLSF